MGFDLFGNASKLSLVILCLRFVEAHGFINPEDQTRLHQSRGPEERKEWEYGDEEKKKKS